MDPKTDKSTVNLVVLFLGIASIVGLGGLIFLIYHNTEPSALLAISTPVGVIVGALGAVLSSTRSVNPEAIEELAQAQDEHTANVVSQLPGRTSDYNVEDPSPPHPVAEPVQVQAEVTLAPPDRPGEQLI